MDQLAQESLTPQLPAGRIPGLRFTMVTLHAVPVQGSSLGKFETTDAPFEAALSRARWVRGLWRRHTQSDARTRAIHAYLLTG